MSNDENSIKDFHTEIIKRYNEHKLEQEADPEWQKNNLEWDLKTADWIVEQVKNDDIYAQHLYATLCNNEFVKNEVWQVLKDETWSCTWRYAGGVVADIQEQGDYMSWYCSGHEGEVFPEIEQDLVKLGWKVL